MAATARCSWFRAIATFLVYLDIEAAVAVSVHIVAVPHGVCRENGDWIEIEPTDDHPWGLLSSHSAAKDGSAPPSDHTEHHCPLARATTPGHHAVARAEELAPCAGPGSPCVSGSPRPRQAALLRVAPKTSPPQ
jgi:hypothetical protein